MHAKLFHIYGPIYINSYGVAIAIGLLLFIWLVLRDPQRKKLISEEHFFNVIWLSTLSAFVGGRLLFILNDQIFSWAAFEFWDGGFSILGSILGVIIGLSLYLRKIKVPVLEFFDLASSYAPLLQSISRIGCLLAGCCYGLPTSLPWGITYTDIESRAPLYCKLHPTQIYSALSLFVIFVLLQMLRKYSKKPGQIFFSYLMLVSLERFVIDFLRANRALYGIFSMQQWIGLGIFFISLLLLLRKNFK